MIQIFISYRRDDAAHAAQRLRAFMREKFGADAVFIDRDIEPGADWAQVLRERLAAATDVVVLVGDGFIGELRRRGGHAAPEVVPLPAAAPSATPSAISSATPPAAPPGGDEPDWLHVEIATALALKKPIYPVLIGRLDMPGRGDLPADIADFAAAQAVFAREPAFDAAMAVLAKTLAARHGWTAPPAAAGTPDTARGTAWVLAPLVVLAIVWGIGRLVAWLATGSGEIAGEAALWLGALYALTTLLWGVGPYLVYRAVAELRTRAHLPVTNLHAYATMANVGAVLLAGGSFLLQSTREGWALHLLGLVDESSPHWRYALQGGVLLAIVFAAIAVALFEPEVRRWSASPRRMGSAGLLGAAGGVAAAAAWFAWSLYRSLPALPDAAAIPTIGYFGLAPALAGVLYAWDRVRWALGLSGQTRYGHVLLALAVSLYAACTLGYFAHGPVLLFGVLP